MRSISTARMIFLQILFIEFTISLQAEVTSCTIPVGTYSHQENLAWGVIYYYDSSTKAHVLAVDLNKALVLPAHHGPQAVSSVIRSANSHIDRQPGNSLLKRAVGGINGGYFNSSTGVNQSWLVRLDQQPQPPAQLYTDEQKYRVGSRAILVIDHAGDHAQRVWALAPLSEYARLGIRPSLSIAPEMAGPLMLQILDRYKASVQRSGSRFLALQGGGLLLPFNQLSSSWDRGAVDNWQNPDQASASNTSRTAVGIVNPACLLAVTVDKPGVPIRPHLANLLASRGAGSALAYDGGGSTQMALRRATGVYEVSRNEGTGVRSVPTSLIVNGHSIRVKVTDALGRIRVQGRSGFFDRTVSLFVPPGFHATPGDVVLSQDPLGGTPFDVDDYALVYVSGPSGTTRSVVLQDNNAYGKPVGEQWVLPKTHFEEGLNHIRVVLLNRFDTAANRGPNAGSSSIWIVIR